MGTCPVCVLVLIRYIGTASLYPDDQSVFLQTVQSVADRLPGISKLFLKDMFGRELILVFKHSAGDQGAAPVIKLLVFQIILILTSRCSGHIIKPPMLLLMPAFPPHKFGQLPLSVPARWIFPVWLFDNLQGLAVCEDCYEYQEYHALDQLHELCREAHHGQSTV